MHACIWRLHKPDQPLYSVPWHTTNPRPAPPYTTPVQPTAILIRRHARGSPQAASLPPLRPYYGVGLPRLAHSCGVAVGVLALVGWAAATAAVGGCRSPSIQPCHSPRVRKGNVMLPSSPMLPPVALKLQSHLKLRMSVMTNSSWSLANGFGTE